MHTLSVTVRTETGKRTDGQMPAVVYGPKQPAIPVSVNLRELEALLRQAGESSVIELTGLEKPTQVLIQELDRDPVSGTPRHADFYAVEKGAKVEVSIPLVFEGESMAVKLGANLVKVLHEIDIEAAPANLPQEIVVDVTSIAAVGDQVRAGDIKLPSGVELKTDPEEVVILAQEPQEEEEATEAVDMSAIEVEQKGKTEGGEEETPAE